MSTKKNNSGFWDSIESYVVRVGKWAWLWPIVYGIIYLILSIYPWYLAYQIYLVYGTAVTMDIFAWFIYDLIYVIFAIFFTLVYVLPRFSKKCGNKEWQWLVDDVWYFGSTRVPKMLVIGIILSILGRGYGGATIIGPAILIIWFAPVTVNWKGNKKTDKKPTNKVVEVKKPANKPVETKKSVTSTSSSKPTTTASKPTTTASKPTTTASKPTTTASKPTTTASKSTTTASKPTTTASKPTTTASKPTNSSQKNSSTKSTTTASKPTTSSSSKSTTTTNTTKKTTSKK